MKKLLKTTVSPLGLLFVGILLILWQAPIYTTEAIVKVSSLDEAQSIINPLFNMNTSDQNNIVEDILRSKETAYKLTLSSDIMEHYNSVPYYQNYGTRVKNLDLLHKNLSSFFEISYNEDKQTTSIKVSAYNPQTSLKFSNKLIDILSFAISRQNDEKVKAQISPTKKQMEAAFNAAEKSKQELLEFENKHSLNNPDAILEGKVIAIVELQKQIQEKQVHINQLLTYMHPQNASVMLAQKQLHHLKQSANKLGIDGMNDTKTRSLLTKHKQLSASVHSFEQAYQLAQQKYATVKLNAQGKTKHITIIAAPIQAQQQDNSKRFLALLVLIVLTIAAFALKATLNMKNQKGH